MRARGRAARAVVLDGALTAGALSCFSPAYESGRLQCRVGRCPAAFYCRSDDRTDDAVFVY